MTSRTYTTLRNCFLLLATTAALACDDLESVVDEAAGGSSAGRGGSSGTGGSTAGTNAGGTAGTSAGTGGTNGGAAGTNGGAAGIAGKGGSAGAGNGGASGAGNGGTAGAAGKAGGGQGGTAGFGGSSVIGGAAGAAGIAGGAGVAGAAGIAGAAGVAGAAGEAGAAGAAGEGGAAGAAGAAGEAGAAGAAGEAGAAGAAGSGGAPAFTCDLTAIAPTVFELVTLTTDNRLLRVRSNALNATAIVPITGLPAGVTALGIEFRPLTAQFLLATSDNAIYTVDPATGAALLLSTPTAAFSTGPNQGIDVNPTVDRLRFINEDGSSFRINYTTPTPTLVTDTPVAYAATDANAAATPKISAAAYTNGVPGSLAASTTLFDIDTTLDILVRQDPPNNGTLNTIGELKLGADKVDFGSGVAFDIASYCAGDAAPKNDAWIIDSTSAGDPAVFTTRLYKVDLGTGALTLGGTIPVTAVGVHGLAVRPVVEAVRPAFAVIGLTTDGKLAAGSTAAPSVTQEIAVTGTTGTLIGLDYRPANQTTYVFTSDSKAWSVTQLGVATLAATFGTPLTAGAAGYAFDFNPAVDRLRAISSSDGQNLRINLADGVTLTDTPLQFAAGDVSTGAPSVVAAAYINDLPVADVASTGLYDIDSERDVLLLQTPPNAGTLRTIGPLGQNFSATAAFEIVTVRVDGIPVNYGYALDNGTLYTIDLATGAATSVGAFGAAGKTYTGLTVRPLP